MLLGKISGDRGWGGQRERLVGCVEVGGEEVLYRVVFLAFLYVFLIFWVLLYVGALMAF